MISGKFCAKKVIATNTNKQSKGWIITSAYILLLTVLSEALLALCIWRLQILPTKFMTPIFAGLALIPLALCPLLFRRVGKGHLRQIIAYALCVADIAACATGSFALAKLNETVEVITQYNTISTVFGIYVDAEDPAQNLEDTKGYRFCITDFVDYKHTWMAVQDIKTILGGRVSVENCGSLDTLVDALYNKETQAIVVNQAYVDMLVEMEDYADFFTRTKLLYEHTVTETVEATEPVLEDPSATEATEARDDGEFDPTKTPFVVYLSGSDTRSSTLVKGRSDVNILAAINPVTKQILLINTPRDYYVANPAGGGEKDKLTHCGLYGIENSMAALSDLYGQPVTYYAQINFTGFETLVNAVGGISVYSDVAFEAAEASYQVKVGYNTMNGAQALAFARERHNLASGDIARGKNQMKIIAAIVEKLTAGTLIKNYSAILDSLQGMFVTNMSSGEISDLIKMQLDDMAGWEVMSYAVYGPGGSDTNYSMPGLKAYVMYPNWEMVGHASDLIGKLLDGQVLTPEQVSGK